MLRFIMEIVKNYDLGVQTDLALPLFLGQEMVPAKDYVAVANNLIKDVTVTQGNKLSTGILGTKYLMLVLSELGRTDLAVMLSQTPGYPGWTWEFDNQTYEVPATTLWELWDAPLEGPGMNSRNHIMFGSWSDWAFKYLAGIQQPNYGIGYSYLVFSPPGFNIGVNNVDAKISWQIGDVRSNWNIGKTSAVVNVTLPVNIEGEVQIITSLPASQVVITETEGIVWKNGMFVPGVKGVKSGTVISSHAIVLYLDSGRYSFVQSLS